MAAHCTNGNDNPSSAEVGRYVQQASMAALITLRIFLVLAGQVAITRGQDVSCELSVSKITPPLVPSLSLEKRSLHARRRVSFIQAPSSTSRSQAIAPKFYVFQSPISNCLPLTSTICFRTSCPIFLFMSITRRNLGLQVLSYFLASNLFMALNIACWSPSPLLLPHLLKELEFSVKHLSIISQIPYIPSHFLD